MRSPSSMGMMAALALAAGSGLGNAVEVVDSRRNDFPLAATPPRPTKHGKRLETRTAGGNWQGKRYLSYAEHDECTRAAMAFPYNGRARDSVTYDKRREVIEARR